MAYNLALNAHPLMHQLQNALNNAHIAVRSALHTELRKYHREHRLFWRQRFLFDESYTVNAREALDNACCTLLAAWRSYRVAMNDRSIVYITQKHRFLKFQKQTFYELALDSGGNRRTNVFEQLCALNIMGTCPHFEPRLIMVIAKYLLPSEEQHKPYYGYAGKSIGAQIDCTYEQPKIGGEICTKAELYAHNNPVYSSLLEELAVVEAKDAGELAAEEEEEELGAGCTKAELYAHNNPVIHADELLEDGWDYNSSDDEEWA